MRKDFQDPDQARVLGQAILDYAVWREDHIYLEGASIFRDTEDRYSIEINLTPYGVRACQCGHGSLQDYENSNRWRKNLRRQLEGYLEAFFVSNNDGTLSPKKEIAADKIKPALFLIGMTEEPPPAASVVEDRQEGV